MVFDDTNDRNSEYWNELCGTNTARILGINDSSPQSLHKFDTWFFDFYPYLEGHLKPVVPPQSKVLEVGLGYGSVASYLIQQDVAYVGVDIAPGPVEMANLRSQYLGSDKAFAIVGDVLNLTQFSDNTFDHAVAIGSLHHTGDFDRAISEVFRVTRPNGAIVGMVYSLFSIRNWILKPKLMLSSVKSNLTSRGVRIRADRHLRWLSDHNSSGDAAPATEYFSRRALRHVLDQYGDVHIHQNLDQIRIMRYSLPKLRKMLIATPLSRIGGLDLYFTITVKK